MKSIIRNIIIQKTQIIVYKNITKILIHCMNMQKLNCLP